MNILIAGLVAGVQAQRLMEEGGNLGINVGGCYTSQLVLDFQDGKFNPYLRGSNTKLEEFDIIYLMTGGKRRWDWYTTAKYLKDKYGTVVVNQKAVADDYNYYLSSSSDYVKQVDSNIPFPNSKVFFDINSAKAISVEIQYPKILKISAPGMTSKGRGVFKINDKTQLLDLVRQHQEEATCFILRDLVPNNGDIRIFTVGYKAIGAMKRTPKDGDFKSNISQGGYGEVFDLEGREDIRKIAEELSLVTRTQVAGVDIIIDKESNKPYVLEINPGPQFEGLETYTNVNAAKAIIEYFVSLVDKK